MTWQEIARLAFLADALGELGHSNHEAAHMLRGYRSAGHPNSKESRRLRKAEDFAIAVLRQHVAESRLADVAEVGRSRVRTKVPCSPFVSESLPEDATPGKWPWSGPGPERKRSAVDSLNCLSLSNTEFKQLSSRRELYMEDALILKDEMERQKLKDAGEEVDDDDDDDDEEEQAATPDEHVANGEFGEKTSSIRTKKVADVGNGNTAESLIGASECEKVDGGTGGPIYS
jgi:hypothetical protein